MKKILLVLKNYFIRKQFRYGAYAAGMTVGFIIVVLLVNIMVAAIDDKYDLSLDLTANRVYSLTAQTEHILENLNQDIYIYTLFDQGSEDSTVQELLDKYKSKSKYIHVSNIDMVRNPGIVAYYKNVREMTLSSGGIILSTSEDTTDSEQNFKLLNVYDLYSYNATTEDYSLFTGEDAVTGAIQYILNPNIPKVWFLEGHGTNSADWAEMKIYLEEENYDTESLSLVQNPDLLEKDDILIVLGPTIDLSEDERETLLNFSIDGGKTMFLFHATNVNDLPNFLSILSHYNVSFEDGLVIEDANNYGTYYMHQVNIIPIYNRHTITNPLSTNAIPVVISYSGAIDIGAKQSGITVETLMKSSESSYLTDIDEEINEYKEDGAKEGPFSLAIAIIKEESLTEDEAKIVVIANASSFVKMSQMPSIGNYEFFMNSISWMNPVEDDFYIRGKSLKTSVLYFKTMGQIWSVIILVCIIIPIGAFVAGLIVFLRRRHL